MDDLIKSNMGLVKTIVGKFNPQNYTEYKDMLDAGTIGLWKALKKYDKSKGSIATFAWRPIYWAIIKEIGKNKRRSSLRWSNEPYVYRQDELWECLTSDMSDSEKKIIELRCNGYTFHEICELVKEPASSVKNKFYKLLSRLKEANLND